MYDNYWTFRKLRLIATADKPTNKCLRGRGKCIATVRNRFLPASTKKKVYRTVVDR